MCRVGYFRNKLNINKTFKTIKLRNRIMRVALSLAIVVMTCSCFAADNGLLIESKYGTIRGYKSKFFNDTLTHFLGK